jgi:hypothetical protein
VVAHFLPTGQVGQLLRKNLLLVEKDLLTCLVHDESIAFAGVVPFDFSALFGQGATRQEAGRTENWFVHLDLTSLEKIAVCLGYDESAATSLAGGRS